MSNMLNDVKEKLLDEAKLDEITTRLGKQISEDYEGKDLVIVGLMKGCLPFMMDLIKKITIPCEIDFLRVSSYHGTKSTTVLFKKDIEIDIAEKHVLIIDDIIDTGKTLKEVVKVFDGRNPASVESAVLLDKPEGGHIYQPKYVGAIVPNKFVIGYGLDYNEKYRNLPFVGVLKEEVYK